MLGILYVCGASDEPSLLKSRPQISKERLSRLLSGSCKCPGKTCYQQFEIQEVQSFLDAFEKCNKLEQDNILYMATSDSGTSFHGKQTRREFYFLNKYLKRTCFEALIGVSSHRIDRIGALDLRYGSKKPGSSRLSSSIDSFALILYNSIAEPLPDRPSNL